jgi:hypothetical protein
MQTDGLQVDWGKLSSLHLDNTILGHATQICSYISDDQTETSIHLPFPDQTDSEKMILRPLSTHTHIQSHRQSHKPQNSTLQKVQEFSTEHMSPI